MKTQIVESKRTKNENLPFLTQMQIPEEEVMLVEGPLGQKFQ